MNIIVITIINDSYKTDKFSIRYNAGNIFSTFKTTGCDNIQAYVIFKIVWLLKLQ